MKHFKYAPIDFEPYPPFTGFPLEGLRFLQRLKRNNRKEWFEKHKEEYDQLVKLPIQSLIVALQPYLREFAPRFEVDPKRSLFRIHRDVRFSSDKRPYKTHIAAHFVLRGKQKGTSGLGYYLHFEPGEGYIGGGLYMPDSEQLKKIRLAIAQRSKEFLTIVENDEFRSRFLPLEGEKLKKIPRGFEEYVLVAQWLKLKQFYAGEVLTTKEMISNDIVDRIVKSYRLVSPWVHFLADALE